MQKKTTAIIAAIMTAAAINAKSNIGVEVDSTRNTVCLDEVEVVSTIKETSRMRQLPSSVSLISNQQIEAAHVTSLKGVSALVPNLFIPDYGSRLTSAIYIRGIGSRLNTPAVGLYVDNVPYIDKSAFDFNFQDIERVDVLRGPQGTLYGRNAMGGIVRIYTKNPFTHQGTDIRLGYATGDNHRNASLTHYHCFSDAFAISAGGYYEGGDGFFSNTVTGKKADGMSAFGGRMRGIARPSSVLNIDFSLSYDYNDEKAYPYFYTGSLTDPAYLADRIGTIDNNRESRYRRSMFNAGANIEYLAPHFVMNAVTGYQYLNDRMFMDQDFIHQDIYTLEQRQRINTLSEEVTFKSRNKGLWHWVSGVNIFYQSLHTDGPVNFYGDGMRWLEQNINSHMPDVRKISSLANMGFTNMAVNLRGESLTMGGTFNTPSLGLAAFHESTFNILPRFSATVGLRLDYEDTRMTYNAPATIDYGFLLANPHVAMMQVDLQNLSSKLLYDGKINRDYLTLLPKASLKYDLNGGSNIYATISKGQRAGGYNVQMFSDLLQGSMQNAMMQGILQGVGEYLQSFTSLGMPAMVIESVTKTMKENMPIGDDPTVEQVIYKPEYSWNYEIGTHLNINDRSIQIDAAAFLINTYDQQIARFAPTGFGRMMVNAGKSRSYGAELTALWRPDNHWTLCANYGYTHAEFTDYDAGDSNDYTGNAVPFVPRHTIHGDISRSWHISDSGILRNMTLGLDYSGAGSIYWTESNSKKHSYYSLLGARLEMETPWATLMLWGRNLTDTKYNTFYFESANRGFEQHSKPLQIGLDVKIKL